MLLKQLKEAYGAKAGIENKDPFVARLIYRPISFYVATPFAWAGFSANQVSFVGLIVNICGLVLLMRGGYEISLVGSGFLVMGVFLDFADGDIARFRNAASYFGKFIDGVIDTFINSLIPLAVSVGLYLNPDSFLLYLDRAINPGFVLVAGGLCAMAISFQTSIIYRYKTTTLEVNALKSGEARAGAAGTGGSTGRSPEPRRLYGRIIDGTNAFLNLETYFMFGGIILFAFFDILSVFLVIHLVARLAGTALDSLKYLVKARKEFVYSRQF